MPVAALVVVCTRAAVPESRDPHAARGLDLVGAGLAVVSLGAATWALTEAGPRGWTDAGGHRRGRARRRSASPRSSGACATRSDPLVPPALFRSREFTVTNLATVLLYSALGVSFFLVVYELQVGVGLVGVARGHRAAARDGADARVRRRGRAGWRSGSGRACS